MTSNGNGSKPYAFPRTERADPFRSVVPIDPEDWVGPRHHLLCLKEALTRTQRPPPNKFHREPVPLCFFGRFNYTFEVARFKLSRDRTT
jgi:hypothetical protein